MGEVKRKLSACALGTLLAVLMVPGAVARADQTDTDFTNFVESHGVHLGTPSQTVNMARTMCQDLDAGYSQNDEIDQLTGSQKLTEEQAEFFIGAATADYCPAKHPESRPNPNQ